MVSLPLMLFYPSLEVKTVRGIRYVRDPIRKRWMALQPEELVRQLTLLYLIRERGYPVSRIAVEKQVQGHHLQKRFDILVYAPDMTPFLLVECKAPDVPVNEQVFLQAANYNLALEAPFFLLTNGPDAYCGSLDYAVGAVRECQEVPDYPEN